MKKVNPSKELEKSVVEKTMREDEKEMASFDQFFNILRDDHRKITDIMSQIERSSSSSSTMSGMSGMEDTWMQFKSNLVTHMKAEEKAFYPLLQSKQACKQTAQHALEEHQKAESIFNQLDQMPRSESSWSDWKSKFGELRNAIQEHIREEESTVFNDSRKCLNDSEIQNVLQQFQDEKQGLMSTMMSSPRSRTS